MHKISIKSVAGMALLTLCIFSAGALFTPTVTSAQEGGGSESGQNYVPLEELPGITNESGEVDVTSENSLPEFANQVAQIMIGLAIALAVIMLMVGGATYMTSGSFTKKNQAKTRMTQAITGLLLALSGVLILNTINPDLTETEGIEPVPVETNQITPPGFGASGWCSKDTNNISGSNKDCYGGLPECRNSLSGGTCVYITSSNDKFGVGNDLGTPHYCYRVDVDGGWFVGHPWYCSKKKGNCENSYKKMNNRGSGFVDGKCKKYDGDGNLVTE